MSKKHRNKEVEDNMLKLIRALQTKSSYSTRKIAELFTLDLEFNEGRILNDIDLFVGL